MPRTHLAELRQVQETEHLEKKLSGRPKKKAGKVADRVAHHHPPVTCTPPRSPQTPTNPQVPKTAPSRRSTPMAPMRSNRKIWAFTREGQGGGGGRETRHPPEREPQDKATHTYRRARGQPSEREPVELPPRSWKTRSGVPPPSHREGCRDLRSPSSPSPAP
jgi:hypothetical protein